MQGNDTDDVLTESVTNSFNDELQKNLTARTRYTVSSAISTSFDDLTPTVMKSKVNWTMLCKRLIKKGIVSGEIRGYVYFTLPLFEEYVIENY